MTSAVIRKASVFTVPAFFITAAFFSLNRIAILPPAWQELVPYLPYITIAAGMFLSFHFHRGRVLLVLLMVGIFFWSSQTFLRDGLDDLRANLLFHAFSCLLPLNITLFSFMQERGPLTVAGRMRLGFLAAQSALIAWFVHTHQTGALELLDRHFLSHPLFDRLLISQPAAVAIVIGSLLTTARAVFRQSPVEAGFLGSLIAVAISCNWLQAANVPLVFSSAAALMLTVSVLQDSYDMAFRDELTGLLARRALNERLMGLGRQYVIAMVDVDHFKRFNDTYGHDVGDQVLKMVAGKLQGVGGGGKSFRYGGEEFTIVFSRREVAEAVPHLEELRKAIASYQLRLRSTDRPKKSQEGKRQRGTKGEGETVSVTVSIGVAASTGGRKPDEVLKEADQALYRAKRNGRNRLSR
jgi:diguanylate cyclase (GGDEF)-like protein